MYAMRAVSTATCTWTEPVSVSCVLYFWRASSTVRWFVYEGIGSSSSAPSAVTNTPPVSIAGRGSSAARASSRSSVNAAVVCAASASCISAGRHAEGPTASLTAPDIGTRPEVVDEHTSNISALHISMFVISIFIDVTRSATRRLPSVTLV
eukprot:scaffold58302_cov72-Phaeocystis_antarctica.AAC.8